MRRIGPLPPVVALEKALVAVLIASMQEMLKIEGSAGVGDVVPLPFGMHKAARSAKGFPYPTYFVKKGNGNI